MPTEPPKVGEWYKDLNGDRFEVVAIDEDDATVDVQYFDGTVEELDIDTWDELGVESVAPPEDYSGSMDIEREDYGMDRSDNRGDWPNRLNDLDAED